MISTNEARSLLPNGASYSDQEVEKILEDLYFLGNLSLKAYLDERSSSHELLLKSLRNPPAS